MKLSRLVASSCPIVYAENRCIPGLRYLQVSVSQAFHLTLLEGGIYPMIHMYARATAWYSDTDTVVFVLSDVPMNGMVLTGRV